VIYAEKTKSMKFFTLHNLPKEERPREHLKKVGVEQIIKKFYT